MLNSMTTPPEHPGTDPEHAEDQWLQQSLDALQENNLSTPFAGFSTGTMAAAGDFAPSGPHLLVSAPTGVGKTRRVLGPAAKYWDGPAVLVSSKPDLVDLLAQDRIDSGGHGHTWVLDLSGKIPDSDLPDGASKVYLDPTLLAVDNDSALDIAQIMVSASGGDMDRDPFWGNMAKPIVAGLLQVAGTDGIDWAAAASGIYTKTKSPMETLVDEIKSGEHGDSEDPESMGHISELLSEAQKQELLWSEKKVSILPTTKPIDPTWFDAAMRLQMLGQFDLSAQIRSAIYNKSDRTTGSIAMFVQMAFAAWLRDSIRPSEGAQLFHPDLMMHPRATLFIVSPADGIATPAALITLDSLAARWRDNQTEKSKLKQLLFIIDEVCNTAPWPKLPIVVTEARSMGVCLMTAVQSTIQFKRAYPGYTDEEIRRIFPSMLMLTGAAEPEILSNLKTTHQLREEFNDTLPNLPRLPGSRDHGLLIHNAPPTEKPEDLAVFQNGITVSLKDYSQLKDLLKPLPEGMTALPPTTRQNPIDFHRKFAKQERAREIAYDRRMGDSPHHGVLVFDENMPPLPLEGPMDLSESP